MKSEVTETEVASWK